MTGVITAVGDGQLRWSDGANSCRGWSLNQTNASGFSPSCQESWRRPRIRTSPQRSSATNPSWMNGLKKLLAQITHNRNYRGSNQIQTNNGQQQQSSWEGGGKMDSERHLFTRLFLRERVTPGRKTCFAHGLVNLAEPFVRAMTAENDFKVIVSISPPPSFFLLNKNEQWDCGNYHR